LVETGTTGIYNAVGPGEPTTWGSMLATCKVASGSNAEFTWVDEAFLLENKVAPWMELPLWLPAELSGMSRVRLDKSVAAGLKHRPLADTVRDLLAWDATRPPADPNKRNPNAPTPISPEREAELLAAWQAK
jgi:2'-hydroxyisoflavone reductase